MRRRALLVGSAVVVGLSLWPPLPVAAEADDLEQLLLALGRARDKAKTLVGPFTQERTIGLLAAKVTSSGKMTLVRPNRLRWELFAPDSAIYWVGPEGIAYRTPHGGGRMGPHAEGPLGLVLGDLMLLLSGDLKQLRPRYQLQLTRTGQRPVLEVRPRSPDLSKIVRRMELELDENLVSPTRVVLEESERDRTVIRFGPIERDAVVDPKGMQPP